MEDVNNYEELLFIFVGWLVAQAKELFLWAKSQLIERFELKKNAQLFSQKLTAAIEEGVNIQKEIDSLRSFTAVQNVTIVLYHNGIKDGRGVGFKNNSIRYESPESKKYILFDLMQNKPLNPYYNLIKPFTEGSAYEEMGKNEGGINLLLSSFLENMGVDKVSFLPIHFNGALIGALSLFYKIENCNPEEQKEKIKRAALLSLNNIEGFLNFTITKK